MAEYRVEEMAAEVGISVELLRSYQSKGLLPPPRHVGRLAIYGDRHLERLREILDLKHQGYSLRMITSMLQQPSSAAPVLGDTFSETREERLSMREVSDRTGVPPSLLRSLEASGVLQPRKDDARRPYTASDVRAIRMLLALISGGLPIDEFMTVARTQIEASKQVAQGATDLFFHYVREPMLDSGLPEEEEAAQLVGALALMLQATTTLISYNFQRRVLNGILEELERRGATNELELLRRESRRRGLEILPA
ncbi:MAG: MerR family transcriptional regulator [Actinobacteria bacterium]|nr:MerR family transcriptional regulator [Actinomycetota bacterium]MBW3651339.1 MerR family transcriptional regulator [Actinomycetota bacterium]